MTMKLIKTPRALDIEITGKCNLRCSYCSHFSSPGDVDKDLSKEEWVKFFEELNSCTVMRVSIQGGEPFCREDIRDIIEGIVKNRMRYNILSNGALITEDLAAFIQSTKRCDAIQISIDGSSPEIHDRCRGKGAFHKAVDAIKILRNHHIPVTIRVTIHKHNVQDLGIIAAFLFKELELPGFSVNSASYMGICRQNAEQLQLNEEERSLAMKTLLELDREYGGRITATSGPMWEAKNWPRIYEASRGKKAPFPNGGYLTACGCIMNQIAVRADGIIVPCILLGHIELGRINRDSLHNVWLNHSELNRLRDRRFIPLSQFDFCSGCPYIDYCTGGCPASSYNIEGHDCHPNPNSCLNRFLKAGGELPGIYIYNNQRKTRRKV